MIPLPVAVAFVVKAKQQAAAKRGAAQAKAHPYHPIAARYPKAAALGKLALSPAHQQLAAPVHLRPIRGARTATAPPAAHTVSQGQGVKHPTPQEIAQQLVEKSIAQARDWLNQGIAKQNAWIKAHPKPASHAQPSDIAAWLNGSGLSPRHAYPEWGWRIVQKGPQQVGPFGLSLSQLYEPGEALAAVQLGDHDSVTWYVHPSGAWSYHHIWGEDFGQVLGDIANAVESAVSDATKVISEVIKYVQIAASLIPGVGQIVNEVVAAAETALDVLSGANALQIALDSAYRSILASAPGLEALQPILDPIMGVIRNIAGGQNITKAALGQALSQVPDAPKIGDLSPRSVASSLASWVASKVGIHL